MLISPIQNLSNQKVSNNQISKQNPAFGSFPVPQDFREAFNLRDQATFKELLPTPENIQCLKTALKTGKQPVMLFLEDIAYKWKLNLNDLLK